MKDVPSIADLDYALPPERIAQEPLADRAAARLLVVRRGSAPAVHATVRDLPRLLPPATLVVLNDTKVIPARLVGRRAATGGRAEVLLVRRADGAGAWRVLLRTRGRPRAGEVFRFDTIEAVLRERGAKGEAVVDLRAVGGSGDVDEEIRRVGLVPLPPYIRRAPGPRDAERYQTVYARVPGSVAAPTAGLHLDADLLGDLRAAGHETAFVTLHVGPGTFRRIGGDRIDAHVMDGEWIDVSRETAEAIDRARAAGRAILAVGTTVVRALESAARAATDPRTAVSPLRGDTSLYILPGHRFAAIDALLTNFHLPRSTLLALVMAFHGVDPTRAAYEEAIRAGYRFYSYGDAMLILPAGGAGREG